MDFNFVRTGHILTLLLLILALFFTGQDLLLFAVIFIVLLLQFVPALRSATADQVHIPLNSLTLILLLLPAWSLFSSSLSEIFYLSMLSLWWFNIPVFAYLLYFIQPDRQAFTGKLRFYILSLTIIFTLWAFIELLIFHQAPDAAFLNKNSLAALINLTLVPLLVTYYQSSSRKQANWLLAACFVLLAGLFVIKSRGAALSLCVSLFVVFLVYRQKLFSKQTLYLSATALFSYLLTWLLLFLTSTQQGDDFISRMLSIAQPAQAGITRFVIWQQAIELLQQTPWHGLGLGTFWLYWPAYRHPADASAGFYVHNDYLQILIELGIPGLVMFLGLIVVLVRLFMRNLPATDEPSRAEATGLFAALSGLFVHSFFTYNFYVLALALLAGLYIARLGNLLTPSINHIAIRPFTQPAYRLVTALLLVFCAIYFVTLAIGEYHLDKGKAYAQSGKLENAHQQLTSAQRWLPLMDTPFFTDADLLHRSANRLRHNHAQQAEKLDQLALQMLSTATRRNPLRPQSWHIRGLVYLNIDTGKARDCFRQSLEIDPWYLASRIELAKMAYNAGDLISGDRILLQGIKYFYKKDPTLDEYLALLHSLSDRVQQPQLKAFLKSLSPRQ